MNDQHDLETVIRSRFPVVTIDTHEEVRVLDLIRQTCQLNDWPLFVWDAVDGLVRGDRYNERVSGTTDPDALLRHMKDTPQNGIYVLVDFVPYLANEPVRQRTVKRIAQEHGAKNRTLVFVGHDFDIPPDIQRMSASFVLSVPDVDRVKVMIREEGLLWQNETGEKLRGSRDGLEALARHLTGMCEDDVRRLVRHSIRNDGAITPADIERVQKRKYDSLEGGGLLSMELDTGRMDGIGGLVALKRWLAVRREAFLGDADGFGLAVPKGVLLLGVQGAGKSLASKCVAGAWGIPLLRLDFGVLFNKFFGETERNLRSALQSADAMSPCVLWIDEIEKGLSSASDSMDGGVSRRVLGTLLTWMAERTSRVFIAATANDIASLPPELMRKGRFDEIFFVDLPDEATRAEIFRIHLARRKLAPGEFDTAGLAAMTEGFSGAEIEQAIVAALYTAHNDRTPLRAGHVAREIRATRPLSVVMAEKVERLRAWAAERAVSAG